MRSRTSRLELFLGVIALVLLGCTVGEDGWESARRPEAAPPDTERIEPKEPAAGDTEVLLDETAVDPLSVGGEPESAEVEPSPAAELPDEVAVGPSVPEPPVDVSDEMAPDTTAPYWPAFQGPRGDNISTETGLLREWPEDGPELLWTARGIGSGYSTVSLAGGLIYTAGNIGDNTVVTALTLDGEVRWQAPVGGAWAKAYPGTRSTPTIDGNRLYYQNPLGELYCLDARTGEPIWNVSVLERFGAPNITWALAESVLIDGDRVISTPGGPNTAVVALDKWTGETVWQSESAAGDATSYATPTLAEYEGKRLIFTMTGRAAICVDADTGRLYWRFPHKVAHDINALSPIFHDGHVFISSGYRSGSRLLRVLVDGDDMDVEEVWATTDLDNHHDGVVLVDGYLYGARWRGGWSCLEWETGQTMYMERGVGKGSVTYAEGMLYTFSDRGEMGLVPATPEEHEIVSRFRVPPGGSGRSWAYPVVCDGRLYLRHDDYLFCYDIRDPEAE